MSEWNRHLNEVAEVGDLSGAVPDGIPCLVCTLINIIKNIVRLNSQRVYVKLEGPAFIVKCVQNDGDPVIVPEQVSVSIKSADLLGPRVFSDKCNIQSLAVFHHETFGSDFGRHVFPGLCLNRDADRQGISPFLLIYFPIYHRL